MKLIVTGLFFLLSLEYADSFFFDFDPAWETLRITWGPLILQRSAFNSLPLTTKAAEEAGFVKTDPDGTCDGRFKGIGYYKPGDLSVVVLYDVNGYVAGVQMNYVKNLAINDLTKKMYAGDMFIENTLGGNATVAVTAYHVDPAIICNGGRTKEQFDAAVAGTELSFQTTSGLMKIPLKQEEVEKIPVWTKGRCFVSMGQHFWYNTSLDMDCNKLKPSFLLYNHGKLTGYGFAVIGNLDNSPRYEHPPGFSFGFFFKTVPKCINEWSDKLGGVSTVHVYLNAKVYNLIC